MKTPHPGANLKWMKPEDYVEQLQKSFLAKTEEDKADDASGKDDVIIPTLLPEIDERNGKGYDGSGRDGKTVFSNITDSIDSAAVDNISEEEIKKVEAKVKEFSSSARSSAASKNSEEEQMPADLEEALKNMDRDFMTMKYTEDELFEKYEAVLDKYRLNVPKNETGASEEDFYKQMDFGEESKDESNLHPQLRDPYYYKSLRAVHAIFVNRPNQEYEEFLCMQMVPGEIPEKERPKDTFHVVAFESIEDAERFCHLTRSQREANEDPVYTTRPFSVNGLEDEAGKINRGVTVVRVSGFETRAFGYFSFERNHEHRKRGVLLGIRKTVQAHVRREGGANEETGATNHRRSVLKFFSFVIIPLPSKKQKLLGVANPNLNPE